MLKNLVRERLIAAGDEIFGLFEKTIASYEEQLCRAREECERQRRQLDAVCNSRIVIHFQDGEQDGQKELLPQPLEACSNFEQAVPQSLHVKEEEEKTDISQLPLKGYSVKSEDDKSKSPEGPQLHHSSPTQCGGLPPDKFLAPLSDNADSEKSLMTHAECGDVKQLINHEEEITLQQHEGISNLAREVPLCHIYKEEDDEPHHIYVKEEEEDDNVTIKSRKYENQPPNLSQFLNGDELGAPPDSLLAPLSESDNIEEHSSSDPDWECEGKRYEETMLKKKPFVKRRSHTLKKMFRCSICGKTFAQKRLMMDHKRTHMEEKPFCCSLCDDRFSFMSLLVKHKRQHTKEKQHTCSVCGKTFNRQSAVERHMIIHTGERPFSCSLCDKRFNRKSYLTTHMKIHTGEKPYGCSVCGKTFSRRYHVKSHMRSHTGEKPFSCSLCGDTFSQHSNMKTHMKRHERKVVRSSVRDLNKKLGRVQKM